MKKTAAKSGRRVNVAVVGLGFMGMMHLKTWQKIKQARIVAVCGNTRLPVNGKLAGVAGTAALAEKIKAAADEAMKRRIFFMPGMVVRFWPEWTWLKQAVESGAYG